MTVLQLLQALAWAALSVALPIGLAAAFLAIVVCIADLRR